MSTLSTMPLPGQPPGTITSETFVPGATIAAGQQVSSITVPYVEVVDDQSPSQASFAYDDSQLKQVIDLTGPGAWDNINVALRDILGYHLTAADGSLERHPPIRHPRFPNLAAVRADALGLAPDASNPKDFDWAASGQASARYVRPRIIITYRNLGFPLYYENAEDLTAGNEWMRYCLRQPEITVEQVQMTTGWVAYAEGPGSLPQPSTGKPMAVPEFGRALLLPRGSLSLTWFHVPEDFFMDADYIAQNIETCVGCVNATPFLGRAPGTLLLINPEMRPVTLPGVAGAVTSVRLWNITFPLFYFNPMLYPGKDPRSGQPNTGKPAATTRGHNTAFYLDGNGWGNCLVNFNVTNPVFPGTPYPVVEMRNIFRGLKQPWLPVQ